MTGRYGWDIESVKGDLSAGGAQPSIQSAQSRQIVRRYFRALRRTVASPPATAIAPATGPSLSPGAPLHPALLATPSPARYPPPCGRRSAGFFAAVGRPPPCTLSSTVYHKRFILASVREESPPQAGCPTARAFLNPETCLSQATCPPDALHPRCSPGRCTPLARHPTAWGGW